MVSGARVAGSASAGEPALARERLRSTLSRSRCVPRPEQPREPRPGRQSENQQHDHARDAEDPVTDLFGRQRRALLAQRLLPDPWRSHVETAVTLIDDLNRRIHELERALHRQGASHHYVPLLTTIPGVVWVLGYTIAAEIGDITRFATAEKLCGYTGLCPRVYQSGERDRRGALSKLGPRYLRWALLEAATHACRHPAYRDRYQRTKRRLGPDRYRSQAR